MNDDTNIPFTSSHVLRIDTTFFIFPHYGCTRAKSVPFMIERGVFFSEDLNGKFAPEMRKDHTERRILFEHVEMTLRVRELATLL